MDMPSLLHLHVVTSTAVFAAILTSSLLITVQEERTNIP